MKRPFGAKESRRFLEAAASTAVFAAAEPSTSAATGARLLGLRFIDGKLPAIHVRAV